MRRASSRCRCTICGVFDASLVHPSAPTRAGRSPSRVSDRASYDSSLAAPARRHNVTRSVSRDFHERPLAPRMLYPRYANVSILSCASLRALADRLRRGARRGGRRWVQRQRIGGIRVRRLRHRKRGSLVQRRRRLHVRRRATRLPERPIVRRRERRQQGGSRALPRRHRVGAAHRRRVRRAVPGRLRRKQVRGHAVARGG
jgi:hypothetical protein